MKTIIAVFKLGFADGKEQPLDLTSGMTYTSKLLNNVYDFGATLGQFIARRKLK